MKMNSSISSNVYKVIIYVVCIFLAVLSIVPFWIMIMNATRGTYEIQQSAISLLPSTFLKSNWKVFDGKSFDPIVGFINSMIISSATTALAVYFSSMTAYGLTVYNWRLRQPFFSFILAVMMIPNQVMIIGFYQFIYKIDMTNNFLPLIIPSVAAPAIVFFMRQYLQATLQIDIVNSARIDGSGEFKTFNRIILPIMKPAIATQAIFVFVGKWNELFLPQVLLTDSKKYTMPIMVSLLKGDIYRTEYGAIYLGLTLTVLPLFVVYFLLSKYIIAGVALGGVKE